MDIYTLMGVAGRAEARIGAPALCKSGKMLLDNVPNVQRRQEAPKRQSVKKLILPVCPNSAKDCRCTTGIVLRIQVTLA